MLKAIAIAAGLLVAPVTVSAEPSAEYSACMDAAGGVTAGMLDCIGIENTRVDDELNAVWQAGFPEQSNAVREKLRTSQRAWIAYRDSTCDVDAAQYEGGSFASVAYADCHRQLTTDRLDWLMQTFETP